MTAEKTQELVDYLQGTCNSFTEGCETCGIVEDALSLDDHNFIDSEIFLCDTCGWWYEICDQSENGTDCIDCNSDEDEE